jgi:hypothetical protein
VGILIAKLLLANQNLRAKKPVLFICQTNHALDQMLEKVHEFEPNIIRVGGRSESTIMQNLNIANAKRNLSSSFPRRTDAEYEALNRMSTSIVALRAALTQRKVFSANASTGTDTPFSNCALARLRVLLDSLKPGAGKTIDDLVLGSAQDAQRAAWADCRKEATARKGNSSQRNSQTVFRSSGDDDDDDWLDSDDSVGFAAWMSLSVSQRLLLMATYASDQASSSTTGGTLADRWRHGDVSKKAMKKRQQQAAAAAGDGWQTVGGVYQDASDAFDLNALGSVDSNDPSAQQLKGAAGVDESDDEDEEVCDPDALFEALQRELDDDMSQFEGADGYECNFASSSTSRRPQSDEGIMSDLLRRPVNIPGTPQQLVRRIQAAAKAPDVWGFTRTDRQALAKDWATLLELDAAADVSSFTKDYRRAAKIEAEFQARIDSVVLRSAAAIGMTTNGAAKYNMTIRALQPEVIIVEEAAEVSEASIIASLTPSTKHLIIIGDHQQLRPQVSEYSIATHNGLEVSLFERLIRLGLPYVTLTTQRRMHPEISSLITPSIYKRLDNAPSVHKYPPVRGIAQRLFFISHNVPEDGVAEAWGSRDKAGGGGGAVLKAGRPLDLAGNERSKANSHEANFIISLIKYMVSMYAIEVLYNTTTAKSKRKSLLV